MAADRPTADGGGPARPSPQDLGLRLTELRESAGLTLEQVSAATRIRVGLLRSMEAGDFAPCGGAVYARGHLRSIAGVVHADGAELVSTYDRMAGAPSPSAATIVEVPHDPPAHVPFAEVARSGPKPLPTPVSVTGDRAHASRLSSPGSGGPRIVMPGSASERRGSPLVLIGIGVTAVVVLIAAIALALPSHHSRSDVHAGGAPSTSTPHASVPTTPAATTPTAPATLAYAGVNVTVRIAGQPSWVHVTASSGATVFQGILDPGASKAFHDPAQLSFVFGYAPAVDLIYNGKDVGHPPAPAGQDVANATFTPQSASG